MIEIRKLTKQFQQKRERISVLNDLNLSIQSGKMVAITGENGSGKTTLLRILGGELLPDHGTITINQKTHQEALQNGIIHLVGSEDRGFYYRLTPVENLTFFAGLFKKKITPEMLNHVLQFTGLTEQQHLPYYTLSTGMKQRLGFARGMLLDPGVMLLDELDRGIDHHHLMKLFQWLQEQSSGGKTILFATHRRELTGLADQTINLEGYGTA